MAADNRADLTIIASIHPYPSASVLLLGSRSVLERLGQPSTLSDNSECSKFFRTSHLPLSSGGYV